MVFLALKDGIQEPMADKSGKTIDDSTTIHGIVIRSNIDSGSIIGISLPKPDKRFFFLGPKDIPGSSSIDVYTESFPLFATSEISYKGQPIIALFGPDLETVEVKSREIEIEFQLTAEVESLHPRQEHSPIHYRWGDTESYFSDEHTLFERTYTDR